MKRNVRLFLFLCLLSTWARAADWPCPVLVPMPDRVDGVGGALELNINRKWTYQPGWGNYGRAAVIKDGFSDTVRLRL